MPALARDAEYLSTILTIALMQAGAKRPESNSIIKILSRIANEEELSKEELIRARDLLTWLSKNYKGKFHLFELERLD